MSKKQLKQEIFKLLDEYFKDNYKIFNSNAPSVPLMSPNYGAKEIKEVLDSLLNYQITLNQSKGNKVSKFEQMWAEYIGVKHCIMVNSGSSANLLALFFLSKNKGLNKNINIGDEVITPAVTWTTTVSPIWCIGSIPVFVDVAVESLTIIPEEIEKAITKKTKAIMPVHLLGNPCNMSAIMEIAKRHNLYIVEDCCEAHGAEWMSKKIGGFGDLSTFSFFFSHHLSTMEGGAVLTNNDDYAEALRIMRSQGVIRNVINKEKSFEKIFQKNKKYRELDPLYMFVEIGFNLRPTELNGGLGLVQLKNLDKTIQIRQNNQRNLNERLKKYDDLFILPSETDKNRHVAFGYSVIVRENATFTRDELVEFLRKRNIEIRPIMTGLVTEHPVLEDYVHKTCGDLKNSRFIHNNGFFLGIHQNITKKHTDYVADCFDEFIISNKK